MTTVAIAVLGAIVNSFLVIASWPSWEAFLALVILSPVWLVIGAITWILLPDRSWQGVFVLSLIWLAVVSYDLYWCCTLSAQV